MMLKPLLLLSAAIMSAPLLPALAQTVEAVPAVAASTGADAGFTMAQLETMVAPVALYPDTLLMQILVAATEPLDVMKASQHLQSNADEDDAARKAYAEQQDWDESVQVLTSAFPDVVTDMADHIDWTESMGSAMLVQSDDVMDAVQTMRLRAIDNGALVSGDQQTVQVEDGADGAADAASDGNDAPQRTVVIQPSDPQAVYVPQYNANTVFGSNLGGVVATTAVAFGTAALIDDIFDDDDDWNHYWGCGNCGGWNGQPIIREPDIDVDGNVNIGNRVVVDRDRLADRARGWQPDRAKADQARQRIAARRDPDGSTRMQIHKHASTQDDLRNRISARSRAPDIARNPGRVSAAAAGRPPHAHRSSGISASDRAAAVQRTKAHHPAIHATPRAKAVAHRASAPKRPAAHHSHARHTTAFAKHGPGHHVRAASHRGHVAHRRVSHGHVARGHGGRRR